MDDDLDTIASLIDNLANKGICDGVLLPFLELGQKFIIGHGLKI